jgi:hypothetical protein
MNISPALPTKFDPYGIRANMRNNDTYSVIGQPHALCGEKNNSGLGYFNIDLISA